MTETILPHPVLSDGNGKLIKDHTARDFYLKLQEEISLKACKCIFTTMRNLRKK